MAKKIKAGTDEAGATNANQFTLDGKTYNVTKGARIPINSDLQTLSAADICVSPEAQAYLVANGCSCIEEVTE